MNRLTQYASRLPVSLGSGPVIELPAALPRPILFAYSNQGLLALSRETRETALTAFARLLDSATRYLTGEMPADNLTDITRQFTGDLRRIGRDLLGFASPTLVVDTTPPADGKPAYGPRSEMTTARQQRLADMVALLTGLKADDPGYRFYLQTRYDHIECLYIQRMYPRGWRPQYMHSPLFSPDECDKCRAWLRESDTKFAAALAGLSNKSGGKYTPTRRQA